MLLFDAEKKHVRPSPIFDKKKAMIVMRNGVKHFLV